MKLHSLSLGLKVMLAALGVLFLISSYVFAIPQDLVTCIANITNQYFTEGRPLVVTMSTKERNAGNLLQELHNVLKWPFQIYSPGSEVMNVEFDHNEKHESYIMFLNTAETNDNVLEIIGEQTEEIDGSDNWNPRAKFLVVIYGPLSQIRKKLAQEVADELWKTYKIVEIVILISQINNEYENLYEDEVYKEESRYVHNLIYEGGDKENENYEDKHKGKDIDTGAIAFELYTWIPYQSREICADVNIFLVNKWIVAEGVFEKDENLYPRKIPNYFHGCPIVVSPMEAPPIYVMADIYTDENGNTQYDYTGYELTHMKAILTLMNFTIVYKHIPMDDYYNTRVQALFDLRSGLMDVVMGCIPLHPIVGSMNDATHAVFADDFYWLVPCGKPNPRMKQVGKIFSVSLWCAVVSVIVVSASIMWQISKYSVGESPGYKSMTICLINLWAVTLGVGVTEMPRTPRQRTVFLFLVWYSFAINLLFQTHFTSILVNPGIGDQIYTRQELYSSDLIYEYVEGLETFIANAYPDYYSEISLNRKMCNYKDTCVVEYYRRDDMTTMSSTLFTECFLLLALPSDSDAPHFCTLDEVIATILFPMYLGKGSPLIKPINRMMRLMQESGLRNKVDRDAIAAFRYKKSDFDLEFDDSLLANDEVIDFFVFSMSHIKMAFYMLGMGCGFGGVIFAFEIMHFKMHNRARRNKI